MDELVAQYGDRRRGHVGPIAWMIHVADVKPSPEFADAVSQACIKNGCVSYGAVAGDLRDPTVLASIRPNWRRNRLDYLAVREGDVVVATVGNRLCGWGEVPPGGEYQHQPADLRHLWGDAFKPNQWFLHIVRVQWRRQYDDDAVIIPSFLPSQPTVRRPANESRYSWEWLREQGIPVTDDGGVQPGAAAS